MLRSYRKTPDKFDQDWDFVNSVVFLDNHADLNTQFKGHLWVKELFLISEAHVANLNQPMLMLLSIVMSF